MLKSNFKFFYVITLMSLMATSNTTHSILSSRYMLLRVKTFGGLKNSLSTNVNID